MEEDRQIHRAAPRFLKTWAYHVAAKPPSFILKTNTIPMRLSRSLLAASIIAAPAMFCPAQADAQRLLQRLRSRISPLIQEATAPQSPANALPSRASAAADENASNTDAADSPAPSSRYRTGNGNGNSLPSVPSIAPQVSENGSPTGVRQAAPPNGATRSSGTFGQSVLAPINFEDDAKPSASQSDERASIGIRGEEANPGYPAVKVTEFLAHSVADRAGLEVGDFIFAIDGVPTPTIRELAGEVFKHQPGETVRLRIGREGRVTDIDVPLTSKTSSPKIRTVSDVQPMVEQAVLPQPPVERPDIGAKFDNVPGRRGVAILNVEKNTPASASGFKVGDRIVAVDGRMVSDMNGLYQRLAMAEPDTTPQIRLIRDNLLVDVSLSMDGSDDKQAASGDAPDEGDSLIGGLGSVLGGMFGKQPSDSTSSNAKPQSGQPKEQKKIAAVEKDAELLPPKLPSLDDVLALGAQRLSPDKTPPPAPKPKVAEPKTEDTESVKAEIKRLRDQLKDLESKLEK